MGDEGWVTLARDVLTQHGYASTHLEYLGAGAQSACYGSGNMAVLISRPGVGEHVPDLTGHVLPSNSGTVTCNNYSVLQWVSGRAVDSGVRTPRFLVVGEKPRPYALVERAHGTPASAHPRFEEKAADWFGQLGSEIRKTHQVRTTGFGLFVPDGSGGYHGRFRTWPEYLDRWLAIHLCVGRFRPRDRRVLDLLLAQDIVVEGDFAKLASKIRKAQAWPVQSVLTHYDNRPDNVVVDSSGITMLDWGLSLAGIGISQELIKLFETEPTSMESPRVAAFLYGYGLSRSEAEDAVERGKLMLVLDGLGMSYGWADDPDRLEGIRAWLSTVKRLCDSW